MLLAIPAFAVSDTVDITVNVPEIHEITVGTLSSYDFPTTCWDGTQSPMTLTKELSFTICSNKAWTVNGDFVGSDWNANLAVKVETVAMGATPTQIDTGSYCENGSWTVDVIGTWPVPPSDTNGYNGVLTFTLVQ